MRFKMRFGREVWWLCLTLLAMHSATRYADATQDGNQTIGYLMVLPKAMSSASPEKVCLSVYDVSGETSVSATVRLHNTRDTMNYDVHNTTLSEMKVKECFFLRAPPVNGNRHKLVAVTLDLEELGGHPGFKANSTKKLMVAPSQGISVYIKTDKAVYKPGQKVQFRVLQLRGEYPADHKIEKMMVVDPKGRKLMVRHNLTPKLGLVSDEFQLIAEPTQGDWEIGVKVANKKYKTGFKVEEYVLPKYMVNIEVPGYLHPESEPFDVKVCAKYTYGMPVRGKAEIIVGRGPSSYQVSLARASPEQRFFEELDSTGCATVKGDPDELRFQDRRIDFQWQNLRVETQITERGTGVTLTEKNMNCELRIDPYSIKVKNYKEKFKPGLPWSLEFTYEDISGVPLPNRPLVIKIAKKKIEEGNTIKSRENVTTDEKGRYHFTMDTSFAIDSFDLKIYDPSLPKQSPWWWSDKLRNKPLKLIQHARDIHVKRFRSLSNSYLEINEIQEKNLPLPCGKDFTLTGSMMIPYSEEAQETKITYMVVSRSEIVFEGEAKKTMERCDIEHNPNGEDGGRCFLDYEVVTNVNNTWMPYVQIIVFSVSEDGEVVADDKHVYVAECLSNKASIKFSAPIVRPGGDLSFTLNADPKSTCALSIVDKSVHLLGGDNTLKKDEVVSSIRRHTDSFPYFVEPVGCFDYDQISYRFQIFENDDAVDMWGEYSRRRKRDTGSNRKKRSPYINPYHYYEEQGAYISFKNMGLVYLSNLVMKLLDCDDIHHHPIAYAMEISEMPEMDELGYQTGGTEPVVVLNSGPPEIRVRNYFPETWKWELVEIGENGVGTRTHQTMPDTITEWVATSFCISEETGIGLSKPVSVRGFKPIFLSMTLPYSIIRGEEITINTSLFNYLSPDVCLEIVVTMDQTLQFIIAGDGESTFTLCSCGGQTETFSVDIKPVEIGEIQISMKAWSRHGHICGKEVEAITDATDAVERTILVEAEGEEIETTTSEFLCIEKSGTASWSQDFSIPDPDFYKGSERAILQVLGSVMGPVMDNLNHLIRVPYGCGEQNMVTMVPNLVVLRYLNTTNNLPSHTRERIIKNIELGYQRQLNYQREDGSFSAFGESDSSGSTWLTAFVISTFKDASDVIFVDDEIMQKAMDYLNSNRDPKRCVKKLGMVHNKRMMGGAEGKNALNAYVDLALRKKIADNATRKILTAEEQSSIVEYNRFLNTTAIVGCHHELELKLYTKALLFHTYALERSHDKAIKLWDSLKSRATFSGGTTLETAKTAFWSDETPQEEEAEDFWWYYRKPSDAVEVTGYILMGYVNMRKDFPDHFPLSDAYPIVQWLTSQRNAYGGWSSTQNTIIGLSALAEYASETFKPDTLLTISAQGDSQNFIFNIDSKNQMVTQRALLSPIPPAISFHGNGTGCALLQTTLRYNVPRKEQEPSFNVSVYVKAEINKGCDKNEVRQLIACAEYKGTESEPNSNMAVIEIKMLSGVEPVEESLERMSHANKWNGIKRYEIEGKKVIVYFEQIGVEQKCAAFEVTQKEVIKNVQPGTVRVYDYYDPAKEASTFYNLTCRDESYLEEFTDCMEWKNGDCTHVCAGERDPYLGICDLAMRPDRGMNFCEHLKDRACGDTGTCIRTETHFRCSCNEGFVESTWGYRCIREDEVYITPELPPPSTNVTDAVYNCSDERVALGVPCIPDKYDPCLEDPCLGQENCTQSDRELICTCPLGFTLTRDTNGTGLQCVSIVVEMVELPPPESYAEISIRENPAPAVEAVQAVDRPLPCPVCLPSFPKPSEYETVFCPKLNAYVVAKTSSPHKFLMKAVVLNGTSVNEATLRNVTILIDPGCVCNNLQDSKSIMLTKYKVNTESIHKFIEVDETVTFTTKRGWRKVQKYSCDEGSRTPEPEGEVNNAEEQGNDGEESGPAVPELVEVTSDSGSTDEVPKM